MERDSQRTGFAAMSGLGSAVKKLNLMVVGRWKKNEIGISLYSREGDRIINILSIKL